ncbi:MAG: ABC transporter substrate-binding protein [Christensenellales bacterium]
MKKTIQFLLMICLALFLFAACQPVPSGANLTSGKPSGSAAGDLGVPEIHIGLCVTLTGENAVWGTEAQKGALLAVKLINQNGGILNTPVSLVSNNDKGNAVSAVKSIAKLIGGHQIHILIGGQNSRNMEAAQIVEESGIPEMLLGTNPDYLKNGYQYLFRGVPSFDGADEQITDAMLETQRTRIAMLVMDDPDCIAAADDIVSEIKANNGIKIVSEQTFEPGAVSFAGQIAAMLEEIPDGVVLLSEYQYAKAVRELREMGFEGYIFCNEGASGLLKSDAGDAANGVVFYSPYVIPASVERASSDAEAAMLQAFLDEYGVLPECESAYRAYDSVNILARAITDARSLNGTDIIAALKNIESITGIAGEFNYKAQKRNEGIEGQTIYIIYKGKIMEFHSDYKEAVGDITLEY